MEGFQQAPGLLPQGLVVGGVELELIRHGHQLSLRLQGLGAGCKGFLVQVGLEPQLGQGHVPGTIFPEQGFHLGFFIPLLQHIQHLRDFHIPLLMLMRLGVQDLAAADGLDGGIKPHHKMVPRFQSDGLLKAELGIAAFPGEQLLHAPQQHRLAQELLCAAVKMQPAAALDGALHLRQHPQPHIHHHGDLEAAGLGQYVSPLHFLPLHPLEVYSHPLACLGLLHALGMDL